MQKIKNQHSADQEGQVASTTPVKAYPSMPANPEYHYYLYTAVMSPEHYVELIHDLDTAGEGENVHIHLCTPGGDMQTMIAIVHAINRSNANVIAHADGEVASAGVFIFLACREWAVQSYSNFMFHDGSSMTGPLKFNENLKMADFTSRLYRNIVNDICGEFMTEDEIERILDGSDVYIDSEDMINRLMDFQKRMQEQSETEE